MKMHSYISVNGTLSVVTQQRDAISRKLRAATERAGGYDAALAAARTRREELDPKASASSGSDASTPPAVGTPDLPAGAERAYVDLPTARALRKRLVKENETLAEQESEGEKGDGEDKRIGPPAPHPLVDHPDPRISEMAQQWTELDSELVSGGPNYVRWPENISLKNFSVYMLIPSLVYELEFPRTNKYASFSAVCCALG
jgi:sterol O-acyltransferase